MALAACRSPPAFVSLLGLLNEKQKNKHNHTNRSEFFSRSLALMTAHDAKYVLCHWTVKRAKNEPPVKWLSPPTTNRAWWQWPHPAVVGLESCQYRGEDAIAI